MIPQTTTFVLHLAEPEEGGSYGTVAIITLAGMPVYERVFNVSIHLARERIAEEAWHDFANRLAGVLIRG